jgi:cytochrome P450
MTAAPPRETDPDPFGAVIAGRRHAVCADLAGRGPAHRITTPAGTAAWLVTGYDEARQVLNDPRFIKGPMLHGPLAAKLRPGVAAGLYRQLVLINPPDHTRLRRIVSSAFTRRRIDAAAPRIAEIAECLLDAADPHAAIDLISAFAYPLPMMVICELLGVPEGARPPFRRWTNTLIAGVFAGPDAYRRAAEELTTHVPELLDEKRRHPADDLLSALVAARDGSDRLADHELTSMVYLLVAAGHETTVNLIGNAVHALLTAPEQLALLRAHPDLLAATVEEVLRFDGPLQVSLPYVATEAVELGGVTLVAGDVVFAGLLAANRDAARTPDPDRLDLAREPRPHLAFGHGIHHCRGAPLARLEGRIALQTLLARHPRLRLAAEPDDLRRHPSLLLNGWTSLPAVLDPRA